MKEFFPIETPYSSEEYKIMDAACKNRSAYPLSQFTKSPHFVNKFLWNININELPTLYSKLEKMYDETGSEDVLSWLEDIQRTATKYEPGPKEPEELDYSMNEEAADDDMTDEMEESVELEATYALEEVAPNNPKSAVERFVDMISGGNDLEESGSENLTNIHGTNLKPSNLDEVTDTERYEDVVFLQGHEADEALEVLNTFGRDAALKFLQQWHDPGHGMGRNEESQSPNDKVYRKDGYIMSWNAPLNYIGLQYDTESEVNEDSFMVRKTAGQRGKSAPIGKHAPHSQRAKK